MQITRKSVFSGIVRTLDLPITEEQILEFNQGGLIQNVFPHLTDDQREFILTGVTQDEWNQMFPPDKKIRIN